MKAKVAIFSVIMVFVACKSFEERSLSSAVAPLAKVNIGDSKKRAIEILGLPKSTSKLKFDQVEYEVLEYVKVNGQSMGYLTLDPTAKMVVGRSVWIYSSQPEYELSFTLKNLDSGLSLEVFKSCDRHFGGEVQVDRKKGLFIGTRDGKVQFLSWNDPVLTQLQIDEFIKKCSEMQKL